MGIKTRMEGGSGGDGYFPANFRDFGGTTLSAVPRWVDL